jgi:3-oxoacyl-[acyl-carrier protein] reductase
VNVAITYTKDAQAQAVEAVVKAIESSGRKALAIQADAADPKAVKSAVEQTATAFGQIDVLVNNAGTAIPKPFEEATLEEFDQVCSPFQLNTDQARFLLLI